MAIIHDAKDQFYLYAKEFLGAELEQLLDSDDKKDEFYSLCKKFSEISLNAPKFKDPKTGKVEGCFQYDDMDSAKEATVEFVKKYNIHNLDAFMESIHRLHGHAVEWDDARVKSGFVQAESYNYNGGFFGTYYNFQCLPDDVWEDICKEIIEAINKK